MAWPSETNPGLFISTTFIWDVGQLTEVDVKSPEFKELLVRLYQNLNNVVIALNLKDSGYYAEQEFVNGQVFPKIDEVVGASPNAGRQVFRKLITFGALPNTAAKSVLHNISVNNNFTFTRIYGASTDKIAHQYIPLPYSSQTLNENIALSVDGTQVTVTTGINRTNFTDTWIIVEYLKQ